MTDHDLTIVTTTLSQITSVPAYLDLIIALKQLSQLIIHLAG